MCESVYLRCYPTGHDTTRENPGGTIRFNVALKEAEVNNIAERVGSGWRALMLTALYRETYARKADDVS